MLHRTLMAATFAVATLGQTSGAFAQAAATFPSKTITIIVPASPGGAIDLVARLSGNEMTKVWGKPVVIDNKAGATGTIGTDAVAKAAPDGHTLLLVSSSHSINPNMFKKLPYDTVKSFEPVIITHVVPLMLVVNNDLPVKNLKELIAYGKANPGKLSFASSGPGGAPHMSGELFKSMTGIEMTHVPYKGSTAAHPDLMGGQTSLMFDTRRRRAAAREERQAARARGDHDQAGVHGARTCRRWPRPGFPASIRAPGAWCSLPPERRKTSWPSSTPSSTATSSCPT